MTQSESEGLNYLSSKKIPNKERLIFALDVPGIKQAKELVELLGESVAFYKMGLELFLAGNYYELLEWLIEKKDKKVFVDLKLFDVPETVRLAIRQLKNRGATFATVHGNDAMLKAAVGEKGTLKILGVTVLTSLDSGDLEDLGFHCDVKQLVLSRAKRALAVGCDGVISSGLEVKELRKSIDNKLIVVTPGIRPVKNLDDQKRVVDVKDAFLNGSDYIVIGRPIRDAANPRVEAEKVQCSIKELFVN